MGRAGKSLMICAKGPPRMGREGFLYPRGKQAQLDAPRDGIVLAAALLHVPRLLLGLVVCRWAGQGTRALRVFLLSLLPSCYYGVELTHPQAFLCWASAEHGLLPRTCPGPHRPEMRPTDFTLMKFLGEAFTSTLEKRK